MTDNALIKRVLKHDDQRAFEEIVRQNESAVRYSLRQWTKWDTHLADELTQDVFFKAYMKLEQFRGDSKFSTWLYSIAYTTWLNHRAKRKITTEPLEDISKYTNELDLGAIKLNIDLEKALTKLPDQQRIAIHLCLQRGFSHSEAARIMGIPLGTVKTHIFRGRETMRSIMAVYEDTVN